MRQPGAGINQDRFPVQLHEFEMRTQRLEFSRGQGLQQMIGRTRARGMGSPTERRIAAVLPVNCASWFAG
jgi:hypothetical protein